MCMRHVRTCTCASIASLAQRKKTDGRIKLLGRCVTLRGRAPRPRLGPCVDAPQPIDRVTEGFAAECVLICTPCHDLGNFVAFVQLISASGRTAGTYTCSSTSLLPSTSWLPSCRRTPRLAARRQLGDPQPADPQSTRRLQGTRFCNASASTAPSARSAYRSPTVLTAVCGGRRSTE